MSWKIVLKSVLVLLDYAKTGSRSGRSRGQLGTALYKPQSTEKISIAAG